MIRGVDVCWFADEPDAVCVVVTYILHRSVSPQGTSTAKWETEPGQPLTNLFFFRRSENTQHASSSFCCRFGWLNMLWFSVALLPIHTWSQLSAAADWGSSTAARCFIQIHLHRSWQFSQSVATRFMQQLWNFLTSAPSHPLFLWNDTAPVRTCLSRESESCRYREEKVHKIIKTRTRMTLDRLRTTPRPDTVAND